MSLRKNHEGESAEAKRLRNVSRKCFQEMFRCILFFLVRVLLILVLLFLSSPVHCSEIQSSVKIQFAQAGRHGQGVK